MGFTHFPYGVTTVGNTPVLPPALPAGIGSGFGGTGNNTNPGLSNVYFVNSSVATASDASDHGLSPQTPFKTLNFALTKTLNNNNDVIYCGPGHVETVSAAAGLTFPTATAAGVTVYFQGNEVDRAQINYTTSTAATVTIPASNVTIIGARVLNSIDARVDGFIVTGLDCKFIGCEFADATGASSLISIRTTTAAVRLKLYGTRVYFAENTGTQRTEFLRIVGGSDHEIHDFYCDTLGSYSTAVINNVTTASNGILIRNSIVQQAHATGVAVAFVATSTCDIQTSLFLSVAGAPVTLPNAGLYQIDTSTVMSSSGTGVTAFNSTPGSPIAFQKSFTSSAITTSDQTWVTCSGGSIMIEAGAVETDGTGLAGTTNLVIDTNNANGALTLFSQAITALGANKIVALSAGATTPTVFPFVLESGKVLQIKGTVGAGTGAGKVFLNLTGRVLSGNPVLS